MADMTHEPSTRPIRCTACDKPLDSPLACTSCGEMNPLDREAFNCFEMFGLRPAFDVDEALLHRRYLSLTRTIHPDMASGGSEDTRQRSLALSAELNRAYEILRDPASRAECLLCQVAAAPIAEDRSVPKPLLGEIMMVREEIEEARSSGNADAARHLRRQIRDQRAATLKQISRLARALDPSDEPGQRELRLQINTLKYWNSLWEQLPPDDGSEPGTNA
jgi:molecular chaperone HscB